MTVYVAEISGRGIAAFDAASDLEAKAHLADRGFLRDLIVLQNKGRALWDGVSEMHVRMANPQEMAIWQTSRAAASRSGEHRYVFLLPVVDPSHDRFDDDDDNDQDRDGD